jgi:hypothetical protein
LVHVRGGTLLDGKGGGGLAVDAHSYLSILE